MGWKGESWNNVWLLTGAVVYKIRSDSERAERWRHTCSLLISDAKLTVYICLI